MCNRWFECTICASLFLPFHSTGLSKYNYFYMSFFVSQIRIQTIWFHFLCNFLKHCNIFLIYVYESSPFVTAQCSHQQSFRRMLSMNKLTSTHRYSCCFMYLYVSLCNGQYIHTYTYKYTYLCQLSLHPFHPLSRSLAWFSSFFIFYFSILSLFSNVVLLFALKLIFVFVFNIKAVVKCDWVNLDCRSLKFVSFGLVSFRSPYYGIAWAPQHFVLSQPFADTHFS